MATLNNIPAIPATTLVKKAAPLVFVLWSEQFEESIATTFVFTLRKLGVRVKLVGLRGRSARGACGLTLIVDLTLGEALPLAQQASCVVLPCNDVLLQQARNDPRFCAFLQQSCQHETILVVGFPLSGSAWLPSIQTVVCPGDETLVGFACQIARRLAWGILYKWEGIEGVIRLDRGCDVQ